MIFVTISTSFSFQDTLDRIEEKKLSMSPLEELGKDAKSVAALQRKHTAFEHDLQMLSQQVSIFLLVQVH